jgi:hypothetical protein
MNIEEKVCTQKQGSELRKLGLILKTERYWIQGFNTNQMDLDGYDFNLKPWPLKYERWHVTSDPDFLEQEQIIRIPAYDVSELGKILPDFINSDNQKFDLTIRKLSNDNGWSVGYECQKRSGNVWIEIVSMKDTLAQALCDILIILIELKYIKPGDYKL